MTAQLLRIAAERLRIAGRHCEKALDEFLLRPTA